MPISTTIDEINVRTLGRVPASPGSDETYRNDVNTVTQPALDQLKQTSRRQLFERPTEAGA